jgi:hypothetical protein
MFRRFDHPNPKSEREAMMMKNIFIIVINLYGFGCRVGCGGCERGRGDGEEVRETILIRC